MWGGLSPSDGSHYFIVIDEYYETEIISGEADQEAVKNFSMAIMCYKGKIYVKKQIVAEAIWI